MHGRVDLVSLVGTAAVLLLTTSMARAEMVQVEARRGGDRAQVVLTWPAAVGITTETHSRRLHIRFDRPIEGDFWAVRQLRRFTDLPTVSNDGLSLTFRLQREIAAVASVSGEKVLIDFEKSPSPLVAPAATPAETTRKPVSDDRTVRKVNVLSGQHTGFSRIVFDWEEPVGYSIEATDETMTIIFDRPAEFDARQFKRKYLKYIGGGDAERLGEKTKVMLKVPAGSSFRDFREKHKIVLEVLAPPKPTEASLSEAADDSAPEPQPASTPAPPVAGAPPPPATDPPPASPEPASAGREPAAPAARSVHAVTPAREEELRFVWDRPVAAAVFRRGQTLWCVFDAPSKQDTAALTAASGGRVDGIEQQPHDTATVLRISGEAGLEPRVARDGLAWILRFSPAGPAAQGELITPAPDFAAASGPRLLLRVPEPGLPVAVADPEQGDTLVVVPVIPLSSRLAATYTYPQFRLLASLQGIVVQPLIDTLRVRSLRDGVELTSTDGLALSPPAEARAAGVRPTAATQAGRLLDARDWIDGPAASFAARRQALERAATDAAGAERERNRLRLAQFLLGQRFTVEALGVLTLAAEERPGLVAEPKFLLLRGAARLLHGRSPEARNDLSRAVASGTEEAELWAATAQAAAGGPAHDLSSLAQWTAILAGYPEGLRGPLMLWLAEAAIGGNKSEAEQLLGGARVEAKTAEDRAQIAYLEGLRKQQAGDVEGALVSFEQAAGVDPRRGRARAELARTLLLRQQDRLSLQEAIATLEGLRFAWRGDEIEYRLLRELGRLYLQSGDFPAGLRTLKVAAGDFPGSPGTETTKEMIGAFERLFSEGEADRLPPLTALALYDEFKELTPAGDKGAEMVRRLAERLARADLLDPAASLLQGLVTQVSQPEKARLGAELADIRLRDGKPEAALEDLRRTAGSSLPGDLQRQRALLQARALGAVGRGDEALAAIGRHEDIDAELLRADLHRKRGDWERAAGALRRVIEGRRAGGAALSEQQARLVLDLAVALTLAGGDAQLAELDRDYGTAMAATPLKDAFRLLAGAPSAGGDAATLADWIEKATAFRRSLATPAVPPPTR